MVDNPKRVSRSKRNLTLILILVVVSMAVLSTLFNKRALEIIHARKLDVLDADVYTFGIAYSLTYLLMIALPLFMVAGYRGLQGNILSHKVAESLRMCGLEDHQLREKMQEYEDKNSVSAFLLPMLVNFLFLLLIWGITLFPRGVAGMFDYVEGEMQVRIGIALALPMIADHASPIVWVSLGAYLYGISNMIRRWTQSDLTTAVLWRLNVRLAMTLVIGLLLVNLFQSDGADMGAESTYLNAFAFLIGVTPDMFLRWVNQQVKRVFRVEDEDISDMFALSDLRTKMIGMGFWQSDRLAEEGIESVQDLAMKEIPALLVYMRFDTPLLLSWVDRALLLNQVGEAFPLYRGAHISSATQLVRLVRRNGGAEDVLASLQQARDELLEIDQAGGSQGESTVATYHVSRERLEIVVATLEIGPNLHYLNNYWDNVNASKSDDAKLRQDT